MPGRPVSYTGGNYGITLVSPIFFCRFSFNQFPIVPDSGFVVPSRAKQGEGEEQKRKEDAGDVLVE